MTLTIDTSAAIRRAGARAALVEAIRDAPAVEPETDHLEWKGAVDLSTKAWQGELASHVLGFANRDPGAAARNLEGHGYLLAGVEPGRLLGTQPIDPAILDDRLSRYTGGADGPGWEADFVEIDGKTVLVISIDPPRPGDRLWTLRRAFTSPSGKSQPEGRIFVRRAGQTIPEPRTAEIEMLVRRAVPPRPGLAVELGVVGEPEIEMLDLGEAARSRRLGTERGRRMAGLPSARSGPEPLWHVHNIGGENRAPQVYRREVEDYLEELDSVFEPLAVAEAVERAHGAVRLKVRNASEENFQKLRVEIHIDGPVAAFFEAEEAWQLFEMPKAPRKWDSSPFSAMLLHEPIGIMPKMFGGSIDNSASARIRFPDFDLRPGYEVELEPMHLITSVAAPLRLDWVATSTSVSGSARGQVEVAVAPGREDGEP